MPGTARLLKLKLGQTCDQRRDIIHSTRAAIDYLEKMYAKFDDWAAEVEAEEEKALDRLNTQTMFVIY